MAAGTIKKLIVEVVEAQDLLPKDGIGTSSPYVVVDYDGQRRRTHTAHRDLNPVWNEVLEFNVSGDGGSSTAAAEPMEVDVLHDRKVGPSRRNNFLGRVRLDSRQFVYKGEEAIMHFPLGKKSFFGWVRGSIGLKIYYADEPVPNPTPPPPEAAPATPSPGDTAAPEPVVADDPKVAAAPTPEAAAPPPEAESAPPVSEQIPGAPKSEAEDTPPLPEGSPNPETPSESPPPPLEVGAEDAGANGKQPPESNPPPPEDSGVQVSPPPPLLEAEREAAPMLNPSPILNRAPSPPAAEAAERATYDLVDKMQYLFVRIVRARLLPAGAKPHVRVAAYGRHVSTVNARRSPAFFFEWDQTFAFARDPSVAAAADSSMLEVSVWDLPPDSAGEGGSGSGKHFLGGICFDVSEVPTRDPPDSPLATQWYRLEGGAVARGGDLMLATWVGTQADESFPDAYMVDAASTQLASRAKVYLSPKLWYLRATIIEAHDTLPPTRDTSISVRATLGFQVLKTRPAVSRTAGPSWNEDLLFVAAEPFGEEQRLILWLECRSGKESSILGSAGIPLSSIERRVDDRKVATRWLDLVPNKGTKAAAAGLARLHVRVCFDGGYHVTDDPPHASSDFRPSARQLWQPPVGAVELGIVGCRNLLPMRAVDGKGTTDAYAVAKYGSKWARTRTAAASFDPVWNEQYTWPVFDPCTVLTIAVFDDPAGGGGGGKDTACWPMGRIRIRISTLENGKPYRGVYPLVLLLPSGVKRMGEIELAVRFSRAGSRLDLLQVYGRPMLPAMHHHRPVPAAQREALRLSAARLTAAHLSRSEPSLRKEVVMWVLEADPRGFSMRRVRANWQRIVAAMGWAADLARWMEETRTWRNPTAAVLAHGVMVLVVWCPELVAPAVAIHLFGVGAWRYRRRPRGPAPHPWVGDAAADREELDEEFDPVPSARGAEVVRARYDRMRVVGARVQQLLGDAAAQAERLQAVVSWKDPKATGVFIAGCLVVAVILFVVPARMIAVVMGLYFMRHPMFRDRAPPPAINFFRRLPSLSDRIL